MTFVGLVIAAVAPDCCGEAVTKASDPTPAAARRSGYTEEPMRVLVAEDNDLVRHAVCSMMRTLDAAVVEARSGKELISRMFGPDRFDLVICDIALPERSGVAVARTARAAGIATPFLFVSGFDVDTADIHRVGAAAFLAKPFALTDLEAAVHQLCG